MVQRAQEFRPSSEGEANAEPSSAMCAAERERGEARVRHAAADWTETDNEDDEDSDNEQNGGGNEHGDGGSEDGDEMTPLLPVFSMAHLDSIPVYSLTHAIRSMVLPRSEATLSWDQLRSPQVSQFLIKPIQQQILTSHFSRAILYVLMANCLQFGKEAQSNPRNMGTSRTRAMVCELVAIEMLKEYSTRELIDALSYDFYPLQGLGTTEPLSLRPSREQTRPAAVRISTLEVAIRAQAKRFLAHPLITQQLEAIWAGTIVFHSAADQLHRSQSKIASQERHYGANARRNPRSGTSPDKLLREEQLRSESNQLSRQIVRLYDPRDASPFKLSRLRVPRYRQFFSTCSLTVLLCMYLAVLSMKSSEITTLEILFWFWSAGFMLDEVVGLNEQGFSFYILSFWNSFDVGMLLFLTIYYCLRLYGIFVVDVGKEEWDSMAYQILAASAVLLFPRLVGVLNHYQYFSQFLITFRLMLVDLAAVSILIIVACSGFFVAFTMAFSDSYDGSSVAYSLFQIFLGFTPAAWNVWPEYNLLGKTILALFLFICHFLIVTILISVLTNSFMATVPNANEEHQFVFAVNTISMVKNDALFSYVAPCNILAWFLTPLRFLLSFRQFVKLNRYVIKATHFPLLFGIYAYEKLFLARRIFEPTDLVENLGRRRQRTMSFMDPDRVGLFSPSLRVRQESELGYQKEKALDDVFQLTPPETLRSTMRGSERRQASSIVTNWVKQDDGITRSPPEQDQTIIERLEMKKQTSRRQSLARWDRRSRRLSGTRSVGSGPVSATRDFAYPHLGKEQSTTAGGRTGDEGDDELLTNEEDESVSVDKTSHGGDSNAVEDDGEEEFFRTPTTTPYAGATLSAPEDSARSRFSPPNQSPVQQPSPRPRPARHAHSRNLSSNTILYNPVAQSYASSPKKLSTSPPKARVQEKRIKATPGGLNAPTKRSIVHSRPHPIIPTRSTAQSSPIRTAASPTGPKIRPSRSIYRRSSLDMKSLDLASDASLADTEVGVVPSILATQMAKATGLIGPSGGSSTEGMMGRLMLARMKILEEGFQEVLKEVKEMRAAGTEADSPMDMSGSRGDKKGKGSGKGSLRQKERPRSASAGGEGAVASKGITAEISCRG